MRFCTTLTLLTCLLTPTLASSHQAPLQIYLHPSPPSTSTHRAPTLSSEQAQAVLAHHFSAGEGVDEFEKLPADDKDVERDGGWVHLVGSVLGGLMGGEQREEGDRARVIIVQGDVDVASILPSHIASTKPSFYMHPTAETADFLQPYLQRASHVLTQMMDSLPKMPKLLNDLFDISTSEASRLLNQQLQALSALASRMPWLDNSRPVSDRWESILVSALGHAKGDSKIDREVKEQGRLVLKGALEQMTTEPSQPPLVLIIMPTPHRSHHSRAISHPATSLAKNHTYNPTCFPSNRTCTKSSDSCSGHGVCVSTADEAGNSTKGGECWSCKCASGYVGVECQKGDYTFQFLLLVFTPLLLLTIALGSIGLLSSVGGEALPSTLTLSMSGKRD